jgi:hypothetical protein
MKILKITGATTDDQRSAVCKVLSIWEHDGTCPADLMQRLPATRLEVLIAFDDPYDTSEAIIVIENNIVAFHPLDNSEPENIH